MAVIGVAFFVVFHLYRLQWLVVWLCYKTSTKRGTGSHPYMTARNSLSMLANHDKVSVSVLLAKAIGFWSCRKVASRPVVEASAWRIISFVGL